MTASGKLPRKFFSALAIGAPAPLRRLPVALERMIHFIPPHIEKIRAKAGGLAGQVDVLLGNLEDAIPADAKTAARAGFIELAQANEFGSTGLWARINTLSTSRRRPPRCSTPSRRSGQEVSFEERPWVVREQVLLGRQWRGVEIQVLFFRSGVWRSIAGSFPAPGRFAGLSFPRQ